MNARSDLSIIVITRNEARHVARTIESMQRSVGHWSQVEMLLVDSASTDETVEIAARYPINIIRLDPTQFLSAAAGRYVGMHHTHGDFIMYMDGDMELMPGWLDKAVPFLQEHPELAGVAGYRRDVHLRDVHLRDGQAVDERDLYRDPQGRPFEVKAFGGAALYRRSALEQVGGFNPYIISDEEPELCMRLRHAGYKLMCLPVLMCKNYTLPINSWDYYVRRSRMGLLLGRGQVLRYHLKTGMLGMALSERASDLFVLAGELLTLFLTLWAIIFRRFRVLFSWYATAVAVLGFYCVKKHSLQKTLMSLTGRMFVTWGIVRGFFVSPQPARNYPTQAEIIKSTRFSKIFDARLLANQSD